MIKIRKIKETICQLYDPQDNLVGTIRSELQLNDVRLQIKEQNISGYYIMWKDKGLDYHINIDRKGTLENWPVGFYDTAIGQCEKLLSWDKINIPNPSIENYLHS